MDEFWRQCPGAVLTQKEREYLVDVAGLLCERLEQPIIVNVGVMWAASMHCLRAGCESAILVGVDIDYQTKKIQRKEDLNAIFIQGDSTEVHKDFAVYIKNEIDEILDEYDKVDFIFFDGDHRYLTVKRDIAGWTPKVVEGGYIAFHDYNFAPENLKWDATLPGVKKAVDEWYQQNKMYWTEIGAPDSLKAFRRVYNGD